jgi:hypothetical protein
MLKMLQVYQSKVLQSSILMNKSTQKKLRKPEVTLPEVLKGGKVYLRTALDDIKAVAATLNGRLNTDTILLRIIK